MVSLVIIWSVIGLFCLPLGKTIFHLIQAPKTQFHDDRVIIYLWLGFIFGSNLFLLISQFTALTPIVGIVTVIVCLGVALITKLITWPKYLSLRQIIVDRPNIFLVKTFLLVALFTAPISAQTVLWADTDGYQYPVIKWLANYGTVKGLGLLHIRFAHIPTATTINALFDHGILEARTSLISNGFMSLLLLLHFCIKLKKLCSSAQKLTLSDWFILCFTPIIYFNAVDMWVIRSANPDLAVMYLAGVLGWLLLVSGENDQPMQRSIARLGMCLAVGAVTLKLNALPLGIGATLFYIYHYRQQIKAILLGFFLSGLWLIPCFLYGWQTSGCPLFPSSIGCGNVPWGFSGEEVKNYGRYIYEFNVNFSRSQFQEYPLLLGLPLLGIPSTLSVVWQARKLHRPEVWILLCGNLLSIIFIAVLAPALRFGIGYIMSIVSLAMSLYLWKVPRIVSEKVSRKLSSIDPLIIFAFTLLILLLITLRDWNSWHWLLPPALPPADRVLVKQALNFSYNFPDNELGLCGSTPLPCGVDNLAKVKLINIDRGLSGGFIKEN